MKTIIIVLVIIFVLWSIYGFFASRVEQAQYSVLEKKEGYEIRSYPKHIVAQTSVSGDYEKSLRDGFRIVASYIFGGNKKKQSIAMTSPVSVNNDSQKIAMTAPVNVSGDSQTRTIAFVMPKKYTLESLPEPTDSRVQLVEVPEKTFAVLGFSWWRSNDRTQKMGKKLLLLLENDGITVISKEFNYAGYTAPFTPPWMNKQEVLVEIKL